MTANDLMNYQPVPMDGKVLVDRTVFDELRESYLRLRVMTDLEESRKQIKEGNCVPADEVFARLQKKYGYKI